MNLATEKIARPISITVICILGFIGSLLVIPVLFTSLAQLVGAWYPYYLIISAVAGLACMFGLWKMKKVAAYAYIALAVINQLVLILTGSWAILSLLIPAIIVFFIVKEMPKMS